MSTTASDNAPRYSAVFLNSRREAIIIFFCWLSGLIWAVPYCYYSGYVEQFDPATFRTIWGIPSWIFWGIGMPWLVADLFTTWFCFCYMKDDDLEGSEESESVAEPPGGGTLE